MSDASVKAIDGRAVVKVGGSELLAPIAAQAQNALDQINDFTTGPSGPANSTYATSVKVTQEAQTTNKSAIVADAALGGTFAYKAGNYSFLISSDIRRGIAIPATGDPSGSQGAWLRIGVQAYDPRWFGAKGDGQTDDTVAIQAALDLCHATGGGTVTFSVGNYKTTAALNVPGTVSINGYGQFSRIIANVCHGFNLLSSDVIGPRRIANIWIQGNGSDAFAGINIAQSFPLRATGVVIENCYISFFGDGILSKGLWHSTIRTNTINQVHRGIFLYNRNVKVMVQDNRVTKGTLVGGSGSSVGIQVGDDTAGLRPEDIQVHDNIFVDFAIACYWRQALFGAVTHNDFDYCTEGGILFVTADGGTAFSDNWIQVDNATADVYGIRGTALGTLPGVDNVEIHNNRIRATDVKVVPGEMHSFGLDFGDKQANISCSGNSVQGAFEVDLRADGVQRSNFRDNHGSSQCIIFNCYGVAVAGNTFPTGMTISGNVNMDYGKNFGLHTTEVFGSITVPAGATTVTATYLSLNMPDLPQGTITIACVATDRGNLTHGGIAVAPTRTAITVTCQTAIPSLPSTIDFHLRIY